MTIVVRQGAQDPAMDAAVERLTLRYRVAHAVYQELVDANALVRMSGGRPSLQARHEEEEAFEALDSARHELLGAAAAAYPTVH